MAEMIDELERLGKLHQAGMLDDEEFRLAKGKLLQNSDVFANQSERTQWEYCAIHCYRLKERFFEDEWQFQVIATGPKGERCIGSTPIWRGYGCWRGGLWQPQEWDQKAFNELITRLSDDGWELLPTGGVREYEKQFRRPAS